MRDINWWLKWTGTVVLIIGSVVNGAGMYPLGPILLTFGGVFWLIVSILWKETSLIVTNSVMLAAGVSGLLWHAISLSH